MRTESSAPARGHGPHLLSARAATTLLILVVALSGCASSRRPVSTQMVPYTPEQLSARDQIKDARYRIRPGDVLRLAFKYEKDLDQKNILVLPDGYISLPEVGTVKVTGLTLPEVSAQLRELYGRDYRNPDLHVVLEAIGDPEIYVLGTVERPGLYKLPIRGMGVMQAVAAAGGFAKGAEASNTVILRAAEDGFVVRTYDLGHIEEDGIMDLSYFDLQPYDIVYVPQSKLGDLQYVTGSLFGSLKDMTDFFWDIYALANIDKIDRLVR